MKKLYLRHSKSWAAGLHWFCLLLVLLVPGYAQANTPIQLEAESATLNGVVVGNTIPNYAGTGYAWDFVDATDNVAFTFQAPAGEYDLLIRYTSPYGEKGYNLVVNGVTSSAMFASTGNTFGSTSGGRFTLAAGQNTVQIGAGWGYYGIDYIILTPVSAAPAPIVPLVNGRAEAELGVLTGVTVGNTPAGAFSGTGYVTGFDAAPDNVSITFQATAGLYKLGLGYNSPYGNKGYDLTVNNETGSGVLIANGALFEKADAGVFYLKDGLNTVVVGRGWGYYNIDYIELTPTSVALPAPVPATLTDAQATPATQALFGYLRSLYGTKTLSGQHAGAEDRLADIQYIINNTSKEPALGSFDLIEYSPSRRLYGSNPTGYSEQYLAWAQKDQGRGIVSLMWHWNAPTDLINSGDNLWWRGFYTTGTTFDLTTVLADPAGSKYQLLLRDIDAIAVELKKFQAANVPVLWRPLHEAQGGWFWWGAKGPDSYKALWRLMHDRLTNYHQLHNLIWVYAGTQDAGADWYPGDAYVDISGSDLYLQPSATMSSDWNKLQAQHDGKKLVALTESGNLPDPDKVRAYATWWSWFTLWSGADYIRGQPLPLLQRVYNDRDVITRDELPNWRALFGPLTLTAAKQDAKCSGNADGSITATFGGGTSTYQVKLGAAGTYSQQASPYTFTNLAPGTYTVFVKDAAGTEAQQTLAVGATGITPAPRIAVSRTDQTNTGGNAQTVYLGYGAQQLTLTASDASASTTTTYSWSAVNGGPSLSGANSATPVFQPTQAGTYTYTLTATNAQGCSATATVTLNVIDAQCGNGGNAGNKVLVCHNGNLLCINAASVQNHLAHQDQLGTCAPAASRTALANHSAAATGMVVEAYPNPFTTSTTLRFRTLESGKAQVYVYSVMGQKVATLYDQFSGAGEAHEVTLNGQGLAAGMYTCHLILNGKVEVVRLMLAK
ncbi:glycosyl hydrolase [Hymenobacter sp.]|jgi:mannan endo-1,4-beta-mannosidase|uniref:glycosyl hydrolase n=1 Tax=Hymenobacter sp. TaxID=1898978 RepID=UPI002EDA7E37